MAAPTISGTPVVLSGFFGGGPITITGYTHTSGDDAYIALGYSYNAGIAGPTGIARGGNNYTKVAEYEHPSTVMKVELWRFEDSTVTTGDGTITLTGSSDMIGTAVAFSANGVVSLGTPVYANASFAGALDVAVTGDANSIRLAVYCSRRSAAFPELSNNVASNGGTAIGSSSGYASNSNLGDRTMVFWEPGDSGGDLNTTQVQDFDRAVILGINLQGSGGGGGSVAKSVFPFFLNNGG